MAFLVDVNYPIEEFSVQNDEFYGECEDCGEVTAERLLDQCQYGFCGRFSCRQCRFSCDRCRDFSPRSMSLCARHTHVVYPRCSECNRRYCDECTSIKVRKCTSCQSYICSKCMEEDTKSDTRSFKCGKCCSKALRPLQEICRNTIRSSIAVVQETSIPRDINRNVQTLPLPVMVKNFICSK
ncbi:hypothetical protein QZH41_012020 [Actinostola sp. cb2023]|nr:hypothetical protein QZH41_012020 [Actinostola sp. cb2023]